MMILYAQAWNRGGWEADATWYCQLLCKAICYYEQSCLHNTFMQRLAITGFVSSQPSFFRLIRKAVWGTMVTNNVCGSVILSISVQTKKGMSEDSTHRKPLLCLVTSFIRAAGDRWMLVTRGTTRSASVFSMGSCPAQPIFSLNRVHELPNYFSQYMLVVTNKHYDKLKFS